MGDCERHHYSGETLDLVGVGDVSQNLSAIPESDTWLWETMNKLLNLIDGFSLFLK